MDSQLFNEMQLHVTLLGFTNSDDAPNKYVRWMESPINKDAMIAFRRGDGEDVRITTSGRDTFHTITTMDELNYYLDKIEPR